MASFAPVAPIGMLSGLHKAKALGDYHLLLAHDVKAHAEEYHNLFSNAFMHDHVGRTLNGTIIMDNSVIELGYAIDGETMATACQAVGATVAVLPDVLLNGADTVKASLKALEEWDKEPYLNAIDYMAIPQGTTATEFLSCVEIFADIEKIRWISVPRNTVKHFGTRQGLIEIVSALCPHKKLHLMGFSDDLTDDIISARHPKVSGIDSAVPLRLGTQGHLITTASTTHSPRGDWWDTNPQVNRHVLKNMEYIRRWVRT